MYDEIICHNRWLPRECHDLKSKFQTKCLDCNLDHYKIAEDGRLVLIYDFRENKEVYIMQDYTGEISFYTDVKGIWYEFIAEFVNGVLVKIELENMDFLKGFCIENKPGIRA